MSDNTTTTEGSMATSTLVHYIISGVLVLVAAVSLILNLLFFITFCRVKRFRRPHNWFLVNLMVVDLLALATWLGPSAYAALVWEWRLGSLYCQVQGVMSTLCHYVNMHMIAVIAMEKAVKFCYPSRHKSSFFNTSVLVIIFAVWLFDLVIALFPVYGWGVITFLSQTVQCHFRYEKSISHEIFVVLVTFVIPVVAMLSFFMLAICKIRKTKRRVSEHGGTVLEENEEVPKDSFAEKLRKQQAKFILDPIIDKQRKHREHNKKDKKKKLTKKMRKVTDDDDSSNGFTSPVPKPALSALSSSVSNSSSSEDEIPRKAETPDIEVAYNVNYDYIGLGRQTAAQNEHRKRVYKLKRHVTGLAIINLISALVYMCLWIPFIFVSFLWTFKPDVVSEELHVSVALVAFAGVASKPLIYLFDGWMRACVQDAICGRRPTQ